jgi:hypothetical protein
MESPAVTREAEELGEMTRRKREIRPYERTGFPASGRARAFAGRLCSVFLEIDAFHGPKTDGTYVVELQSEEFRPTGA